ncbi:MAG: aspartate aminotransferase family protein [Deferribacterota bacterium]|nr:aspartate aminotransferase family protein [Deferribacterota bacterium]
MDYEAMKSFVCKHTFGTWRKQKVWQSPLFVKRAEGSTFYDEKNNSYIDFSSQLMCSNLGHNNRDIIDAIKRQADELAYIAPSFLTDATYKAVKALVSVLPKDLNNLFFSPSGTEANEAAVAIIRQYKRPKYKIISRYRSYHGATASSISLTGDPRRWFIEPYNLIEGVIFAPDCYCYRCPFELEYPNCGIMCAKYVDYMIKEEGNVAAIIVEPVVGTNGIIVPVKEYLPLLRKIADENDALLVFDEVMSGWFRCGRLFAYQNWDVSPDMITTAKGCTSAYTPVGITITSEKIKEFFNDNYFAHGHTYASHPLGLSAIPAAINEYKKLIDGDKLSITSKYLMDALNYLKENHPSIGEVRGLGHFFAVEIVKNRESREPFNTKSDKAKGVPLMTDTIAGHALKKGLYINTWYNHFVVAPPLIITKEEIDKAINIFDEVLKIADRSTSE